MIGVLLPISLLCCPVSLEKDDPGGNTIGVHPFAMLHSLPDREYDR